VLGANAAIDLKYFLWREKRMKIRPEAAQRLQQGFQKHVDEQKRRFGAEWQNAVEFGRRSGLGQAVGIFRAEIHPPLGPGFFARVLAPIAAIPLFIFAAVKGVPGMPQLLFFLPFLLAGWIGVNSLLTLRNRYNRWLFAYADGFTEFDESSQPGRPRRWEDFTDVADSWSWIDSEVGSSSWHFDGLQLTERGGSLALFNTPYNNMLDPYQSMGRLLGGLFPSTIGPTIPQFPTIMEVLSIHLIRRILDRDLATVQAGGIVERAGIRVTKDGLFLPGQTSLTPWAAIGHVDLTPERARIQPYGGGHGAKHKVVATAGPWMLSLLLSELKVQASFKSSG